MGRMGIEALNLMLKESKIVVEIACSLSKLFEEGGIIFDKMNTSSTQKLLNQDIDKGYITAIYPANKKEMDAIIQYLKENGEWCSTASILQENGKSKPFILVKNKEIAEKAYAQGVNNALKHKLCVEKTEFPKNDICLSSQQFLRYAGGENTPDMQDHYKMFHVQNEAEMVDFIHRCSVNGVPIYINNFNGGTAKKNAGTIFYASSDEEKMELIKQDVAKDFTGQGIEAMSAQLLFDRQEYFDCADTLKNLKTMSASERKQFVGGAIIDRDGNITEINQKEVVYKPAQSILKAENNQPENFQEVEDDLYEEETASYTTNKKSYEMTVDKRMDQQKKPVLLTAEEYKQYQALKLSGNQLSQTMQKITGNEKHNYFEGTAINQRQRDFLVEVERKHGRPVPTKDETSILLGKERERKIQLASMKNSMGGANAETRICDEYNCEETTTVFVQQEKETWEASHDNTEKAQGKDANILNDAEAQNFGQEQFINSEEMQRYVDDNYEDQDISMSITDMNYCDNVAHEASEEFDEHVQDVELNQDGMEDILNGDISDVEIGNGGE